MQGDQAQEPQPGRGWGSDWAAASWQPPTEPQTPDVGRPSTGPSTAPVAGVSDTLEAAFSVLRRRPWTVFGAGALLGGVLLIGEPVVWWVARGRALRVLPEEAALHRDPVAALAALDRAQVLGSVVVVGLAAAVCWVFVVVARTATDALVAAAAMDAEPGVLAATARRAGPLSRAGLLLGLLSAALALAPALPPTLWPSWGGLLAGAVLTVPAVLGSVWLWARSSLLGAELVAGGGGLRAAWAGAGRLLRRATGSALVLLVIGVTLAVAVGAAVSSPLQYLIAVLLQPQWEAGPFGWLERSWWDGTHVEVLAVAGAHAVATAIGYPLLSVISALIWIERSGWSTTSRSTSGGPDGC